MTDTLHHKPLKRECDVIPKQPLFYNLYLETLTAFEIDWEETNVRIHKTTIDVHVWVETFDKHFLCMSVEQTIRNYKQIFFENEIEELKHYYNNLLQEATVQRFKELMEHYETFHAKNVTLLSEDKLVHRFTSINYELQDGAWMLRNIMIYIGILKQMNPHIENVFNPIINLFSPKKNNYLYQIAAASNRFVKKHFYQSIIMPINRPPFYDNDDFTALSWKIYRGMP